MAIRKAVKKVVLSILFSEFFNSEKSGGIILVGCTIVSLTLTNIFFEDYSGIWETQLGGHSLTHWINDGLMTIFFLLIGLELEREVYIGELSDVRNALLPALAAAGGILLPAGIYMALNWEGPGRDGAGIPMATDIAFALGVMSMLGKRVPASLKIFLTALAVIDDLCAIIVIAVFYTSDIEVVSLATALGIFGVLLILNRLRFYVLWPYLAAGVMMWYFMLQSGVHATITGVLLAFALPFASGDERSISYKLQHFLHAPVAYFILPVFALANTCIVLSTEAISTMGSMVSVGIMAGLLLGKPVGILLFSYLTTVFKLSSLPADLKWSHIAGAGLLAGIGFTMSIFITLLAFSADDLVNVSKLAIMAASVLAGTLGYFWLRLSLKKNGEQ